MEESILTTIKQLLGITASDDSFDQDIMVAINTAMMALCQIGIGPPEGFFVEDDTSTWEDYLGTSCNMESVKTYIHIKSRLIFDPPSNGTVMESLNKMASEIEWRLSVQKEANENV